MTHKTNKQNKMTASCHNLQLKLMLDKMKQHSQWLVWFPSILTLMSE